MLANHSAVPCATRFASNSIKWQKPSSRDIAINSSLVRQHERLADIIGPLTEINHDIPDVVGSRNIGDQRPDRVGTSLTVQWSAPHVARSLEQAAYLWQSMLDDLVDAPPPKLEVVLMGELAR